MNSENEMACVCNEQLVCANTWLSEESSEATRVYWRLIKQASELWLEQNRKNPSKRKAKR